MNKTKFRTANSLLRNIDEKWLNSEGAGIIDPVVLLSKSDNWSIINLAIHHSKVETNLEQLL